MTRLKKVHVFIDVQPGGPYNRDTIAIQAWSGDRSVGAWMDTLNNATSLTARQQRIRGVEAVLSEASRNLGVTAWYYHAQRSQINNADEPIYATVPDYDGQEPYWEVHQE